MVEAWNGADSLPRILELEAEGFTQAEIAITFGVSARTIQRVRSGAPDRQKVIPRVMTPEAAAERLVSYFRDKSCMISRDQIKQDLRIVTTEVIHSLGVGADHG